MARPGQRKGMGEPKRFRGMGERSEMGRFQGRRGGLGKRGGKFIDRLLGCEKLENCELDCEFGLKRSVETFCHICECATDPCEGVICPTGRVCKVMKKHISSCVNEAFWTKLQELKAQAKEEMQIGQ